jgi:hypothetical protein
MLEAMRQRTRVEGVLSGDEEEGEEQDVDGGFRQLRLEDRPVRDGLDRVHEDDKGHSEQPRRLQPANRGEEELAARHVREDHGEGREADEEREQRHGHHINHRGDEHEGRHAVALRHQARISATQQQQRLLRARHVALLLVIGLLVADQPLLDLVKAVLPEGCQGAFLDATKPVSLSHKNAVAASCETASCEAAEDAHATRDARKQTPARRCPRGGVRRSGRTRFGHAGVLFGRSQMFWNLPSPGSMLVVANACRKRVGRSRRRSQMQRTVASGMRRK